MPSILPPISIKSPSKEDDIKEGSETTVIVDETTPDDDDKQDVAAGKLFTECFRTITC